MRSFDPAGGGQGNTRDQLPGDYEARLAKAFEEIERLKHENEELRRLLGESRPPDNLSELSPQTNPSEFKTPASLVTSSSGEDTKIALFRNLFRGRDDVYALRWESKKGGKGYSPACAREWNPKYCRKPRVKCGDCDHRQLLPLTDDVIRDHLVGKKTVGVYPLLLDETCHFLAADFDGEGWEEDIAAFREACRQKGVPVAIERSRSGDGAHAWIYFNEPISSRLARNLGATLLTLAMDGRPELGLGSYDRLFPNQDTLPQGGFGNLIALPLQAAPRKSGNSVFIDEHFNPIPDQWAFLAGLGRLSLLQIQKLVGEAMVAGEVLGVREVPEEGAAEKPWSMPPSGVRPECPILGSWPNPLRMTLSDMIYVEREGLPPAAVNRMLRLVAFQNPEFYKAQAMRFPVFDKPRIIGCGELFPRHIALPRGIREELMAFLQKQGVKVEIDDQRLSGERIDIAFIGTLRDEQGQAVDSLISETTGILCAGTAFGKTVVGAKMIAERGVNTLVLVHRSQLIDQWKERLSSFLDLKGRKVGSIGGGSNKPTGFIDIATIQSLNRHGVINDLVAAYGQVIVDECHHLSAFSFEQVLRKVKARYVLGLTATPTRRDGHHPIITMQCGPIRFRTDQKKQATERPFGHQVIAKHISLAGIEGEHHIQEIFTRLSENESRNRCIADDVRESAAKGRACLVLTGRLDHMERLRELLKGSVQHLLLFRGGLGKKQRRALLEQLRSIQTEDGFVILATGRYIGEGFDEARLDTLFLAEPVAWKGTLQQYAGRLHRLHEGKQEVMVFDYVDEGIPILESMFRKRLRGYKAMGYSILT